MITPTIFYTLQCDRCKEMFESQEGFIGQVDSDSVWEYAENSDWIEYKGKHYCPDCYDFDEEKDENIPLPAYPKSIFKVENFLKTYVGFKDAITKEYSEHFIVSVHLRTNEQLQKEFLEMIRSILALESWSFEVIPAEKYSNSTLVIKIEKQYKKS